MCAPWEIVECLSSIKKVAFLSALVRWISQEVLDKFLYYLMKVRLKARCAVCIFTLVVFSIWYNVSRFGFGCRSRIYFYFSFMVSLSSIVHFWVLLICHFSYQVLRYLERLEILENLQGHKIYNKIQRKVAEMTEK